MMYRRHAALSPRFAAPMQRAIDAVSRTIAAVFDFNALWEAAWRENRQRDRASRMRERGVRYQAHGLNGPRAMARRQRQIAAGQITIANGLVTP